MGWKSFTQVAKENLHFTWGYWTGNEIRHSVMRALKVIEKDISYKCIYAYMYGKQCEIMQIILQCNRKKGKAIQSLGADLHWHKRGTSMPSQIPQPTWALVCLWNSRGTPRALDWLQSFRTLGWLAHLMTSCQEPTYDERLTWEGRSDKMVQVWKIIIKQSLNQQTWCPNNMVKIL